MWFALRLRLPQRATCSGRTITLPNMDNGLLTEGRINSSLGQINELISPGQNDYNSSVRASAAPRVARSFSAASRIRSARAIMRDGMDFNNQFDFRDTRGSFTLLDQRHRISLAGIYRPRLASLVNSSAGRVLLKDWTLSSVMDFSSGRPYAALLSPASGGDNLNDTAFNEDTANSAAGINGGGPVPGIGLNSFYGPWLERIDAGLARSFTIREGQDLQVQAQAFNLFNHANYYVQNGGGVNPLEYNPVGDNCGDGAALNQTCYLVPNSGPGNFGAFGEISPNGLPRVLQFSMRFSF
jgi:hypothetical protein